MRPLLLLAWLLSAASVSAAPPLPSTWLGQDEASEARVHLYFFWAEGCPHCHEASRFLKAFSNESPWLEVLSFELTGDPEARALYRRMAEELGEQARFVPAFAFCDRLVVGFSDRSAEALRSQLLACRREPTGTGSASSTGAPREEVFSLPLLGRIDPRSGSLALYTVLIAGLDAFNPCAFFVLLFLLSLLVHAHSRKRILAVGGIFVFFSGFIYFLFMAAWLNAFLVMRELRMVTTVAGIVAVVLAVINIKDYFWFRRGLSLSIPEGAKPGLYRRMRKLVGAASLPSMLIGTVTLAVAANSYELLCTAGFPLVFTRILTLNELPTGSYYVYLALYNLVYVIPLAVVVGIFAITLGSRKLHEQEGRVLKLLSGLMMLGLGLLLLAAPEALQRLTAALVVLLAAALGTSLIVLIDRRLRIACPRTSSE